MTSAEIEQKARTLFGDNWKGALARSLGISYPTLWRQLSQENIPGPVIAAVKAWTVLFETTGLRPPVEPGGPFVSGNVDVSVYGQEKRTTPKRKSSSPYSKMVD